MFADLSSGYRWPMPSASFDTYLRLTVAAGVERDGNPNLPDGTRVEGLDVGAWQIRQRTYRRRGKLSAQRVAALDAVGGWTWSKRSASFDEYAAALQHYFDEHGDTRMPRTYVTADGLKLGVWMRNLRYAVAHPDDPSRRISDVQRELLDDIDPDWGPASRPNFPKRTPNHDRPPVEAPAIEDLRGRWVQMRIDLVHDKPSFPEVVGLGRQRTLLIPAGMPLSVLTAVICREFGRFDSDRGASYHRPDGETYSSSHFFGFGPLTTWRLVFGLRPYAWIEHLFDHRDVWRHRISVSMPSDTSLRHLSRALQEDGEPGDESDRYLRLRWKGHSLTQYAQYCEITGACMGYPDSPDPSFGRHPTMVRLPRATTDAAEERRLDFLAAAA
jgi:hypothetical protein